MRLFCGYAFLIAWSCATLAANVSGRVVSIADGDTLTVLVDGQQVEVRLANIGAPERKQHFRRHSSAGKCGASERGRKHTERA